MTIKDIISAVGIVAEHLGVTYFGDASSDKHDAIAEIRDAFYTYGHDDVADYWIERVHGCTEL